MIITDELESEMNRCDWQNCRAIGIFDAVNAILLNAEGLKNIPVTESRFIYLCPHHFRRGVAHFKPDEVRN